MAPSEDRISKLDDKIIHHILSYVPTKDAVTTSVLSKRWTNLWCFVPFLDFSDIKLADHESFLWFNQFFYTVMLFRETYASNSIDSFSLDIQYAHLNYFSILRLNNWLYLLGKRNVKYLNLHLNFLNALLVDDDVQHRKTLIPKLPSTIFTCKTLVVLNISCFAFKGFSFSSVGFGFGFPSLKTLHFNHIYFNHLRDFLLLLAGCPILEDFKACHVFTLEEEEEATQESTLNLSNLIRTDIIDTNFDIPMKALFNSVFLRIQLCQRYTSYDFPTFNNLTHLVINYYLDMFIKVLYHCPNLQNLELYQTQTDCDQKGQQSWVNPTSAPQCLSLHLTTCTIRDFAFVDLQNDIMLARYILNNARVLQTMMIWSDKEQPQIERELSSCPRASTTCQLSVY